MVKSEMPNKKVLSRKDTKNNNNKKAFLMTSAVKRNSKVPAGQVLTGERKPHLKILIIIR